MGRLQMNKILNLVLCFTMISGSLAHAKAATVDTNTVDTLLEGSTLADDTVKLLWIEHAFKSALLYAIEIQENLLLETSKKYDGNSGLVVNLPVALTSGLLAYGSIRLLGPVHQANVADLKALDILIEDYKHKVTEAHVSKFRLERAQSHKFSTLKAEEIRNARAQAAVRDSKLIVSKVGRSTALINKTRVFLVAGVAVLLVDAAMTNATEIFIPYSKIQEYKMKLQADLNGYENLFIDIGQIEVADLQ